jgi:hypothetical protein
MSLLPVSGSNFRQRRDADHVKAIEHLYEPAQKLMRWTRKWSIVGSFWYIDYNRLRAALSGMAT